jgi:hypothetical protein
MPVQRANLDVRAEAPVAAFALGQRGQEALVPRPPRPRCRQQQRAGLGVLEDQVDGRLGLGQHRREPVPRHGEVLVVERQQGVEELVSVGGVLAGLLLVPRARQHRDALLARHDHLAVGLLHLHAVEVVELGLGAVQQRGSAATSSAPRSSSRARPRSPRSRSSSACAMRFWAMPSRQASMRATTPSRSRATVAGEGVTRFLERQLGLAEGPAREELFGLAQVRVGVAAQEFLEE